MHDDVAGAVVERDTADRLRASLAGLPDERNEVIMLACYGQLSHIEIAPNSVYHRGPTKAG